MSSTGQTIEIRNNQMSVFTTEEVLENTTSVKIIVYKLKNPNTRVRIYSILFGYGLTYYNDSVMSSTLESYVSPISEDVPQIDFSVQLISMSITLSLRSTSLKQGKNWRSTTDTSSRAEISNGFKAEICCVPSGNQMIIL